MVHINWTKAVFVSLIAYAQAFANTDEPGYPTVSDETETPLSVSCYVHSTSGTKIPAALGDWISLIATKMHNEQQDGSCAVFTEAQKVRNVNVYSQGIPYSSGSDCTSTAELKTDRSGLISGVNQLRLKGATAGCCNFQHGASGSWHAHVKFKTDKSLDFDAIKC